MQSALKIDEEDFSQRVPPLRFILLLPHEQPCIKCIAMQPPAIGLHFEINGTLPDGDGNEEQIAGSKYRRMQDELCAHSRPSQIETAIKPTVPTSIMESLFFDDLHIIQLFGIF